jgi:hypothetical protein
MSASRGFHRAEAGIHASHTTLENQLNQPRSHAETPPCHLPKVCILTPLPPGGAGLMPPGFCCAGAAA